ncbi:uncharacterized protein C8Q71DRAFT_862098 [Rhodofomes roseus]|uniref:Uncharacterized protein n=1 Tax=Rhodofomes roseus TaxID=34475 RepID=A0ABQ8K2J9_9APHY|nr:uncharacterized protein C8Q71DRAFT_862098 [Rhodofomes roseus]KAH9830962.1 hypothetical protein C8Q71DRAFT_862098 [Rhodofomes roseus]
MSATSTDADASPTGGLANASATGSYLSAITTIVYQTVSNSEVEVITTTSYSGAPLPTGATQHAKSSIPVAPIAGGAAGGVVLAVAVVVAWVWWGKCIKRKTVKERQEALARLQVRENTRKNASSGSFTSNPKSSRAARREKKVSFASTPSSTASTLKGTVRDPKDDDPSEKMLQSHFEPPPPSSKGPTNAHKPVRPSPLGRASSRNEQSPLLPVSRSPSSRPATPPQSPFKDSAAPTLPRRRSQDSAPPKAARRPSQDSATPFPTKPAPLTMPTQIAPPTQTNRTPRPSPSQSPSPSSPVQPFLKRPITNRQVTHKASAASSMSAYSTESGEERQKRVSTSLVMAALGHMDPRRSWLGNYLPLNRRSRAADDLEQSRLSTMSAASAYSQPEAEAEADEHVGYAYGGEESAES